MLTDDSVDVGMAYFPIDRHPARFIHLLILLFSAVHPRYSSSIQQERSAKPKMYNQRKDTQSTMLWAMPLLQEPHEAIGAYDLRLEMMKTKAEAELTEDDLDETMASNTMAGEVEADINKESCFL
ncbi:hypothetical protein MBM_05411 [Drepanopeziza brunnea f. sp. 'multigermtubi' MB_m1]|uniref:Uncharacterized protein n=1 Tax=Marssonina brunnea f. sp. multigermtubi (strain MB_m1) TaxID=1072389 RepID=K1WUL4_MARBU|nr:uncharacterized protein MBM_05411 [Drepanopeziza brunnea f. sp. 'multigermtubi' MB_m1]EKD16117.1 hypothetical protein MBM_05411 [Drepanopeziza brunnea f. sp. 'multigermtubi' MB_m1]